MVTLLSEPNVFRGSWASTPPQLALCSSGGAFGGNGTVPRDPGAGFCGSNQTGVSSSSDWRASKTSWAQQGWFRGLKRPRSLIGSG